MATKAEQIYERVEALKASGTSQADALKALATEFGQSPDSVRGAYYTGKRQATGQVSSQGRKRVLKATTAELAIESAINALRQAVENIAGELDAAKARADEATREHEELKATASERIAVIEGKIAALEGTAPVPKAQATPAPARSTVRQQPAS